MAKKESLSRDRKREIALDLYLNTDKSQKEICEIVGWTENTFKDNKEKHQWDHLKGATTITAQNIIAKLYLKLEEAIDNPKGIDADALSKIAAAIEKLSNKKVTVSQHINCAKEFTVWLFKSKPDLAKDVNRYQMQFINELISNG